MSTLTSPPFVTKLSGFSDTAGAALFTPAGVYTGDVVAAVTFDATTFVAAAVVALAFETTGSGAFTTLTGFTGTGATTFFGAEAGTTRAAALETLLMVTASETPRGLKSVFPGVGIGLL